jgi:hypothetical protein
MIVLSVIDDAVKGLQREPDPARMKKLMVYACTGAWETDPHRLNQASLRQLVEQLWTLAPTLEHLRSHLYTIVGTLNKQAEYTLLANAIIKHLSDLYLIEQPEPPASIDARYQTVVHTLEHGDDVLRAKKLLFCACKNSWQNDLAVLNQYSLSDLVTQLHSIAPTAHHLEATLSSIVRTLNRQLVYQRIMQTVLAAFHPLYNDEEPGTQVMTPPPLPERSLPPTTHIVFPDALPGGTVQPSMPERRSPPPSGGQPLDLSDLVDALFDLRLEVVKYTNPLRAKLLLFFCLREPLADLQQNIAVVRSQELGDLLKDLILQYPSFDQVSQRLRRVATQQAEQHYSQAASAVLRAIKPVYDRFPDRAITLRQLNTYDSDVTALNASKAESTGLLPSQSLQSDA